MANPNEIQQHPVFQAFQKLAQQYRRGIHAQENGNLVMTEARDLLKWAAHPPEGEAVPEELRAAMIQLAASTRPLLSGASTPWLVHLLSGDVLSTCAHHPKFWQELLEALIAPQGWRAQLAQTWDRWSGVKRSDARVEFPKPLCWAVATSIKTAADHGQLDILDWARAHLRLNPESEFQWALRVGTSHPDYGWAWLQTIPRPWEDDSYAHSKAPLIDAALFWLWALPKGAAEFRQCLEHHPSALLLSWYVGLASLACKDEASFQIALHSVSGTQLWNQLKEDTRDEWSFHQLIHDINGILMMLNGSASFTRDIWDSACDQVRAAYEHDSLHEEFHSTGATVTRRPRL